MNTHDQNSPNSIRTRLAEIEAAKAKLIRELEEKISALPGYLGLTSLEEVLDVIRTKNETGSVEAFAGAALPQRLERPSLQGRRGVDIGDQKRVQIRNRLMRGDQGKIIARDMNVSPSTVSGIRKELVAEGVLK